ncbi:MAG: ABC transporter permease [Ilumatobacteraceae bacterium]
MTATESPVSPERDAPSLDAAESRTWRRAFAVDGTAARVVLFVLTVLGALLAAAPLIAIAGSNPIDAYVALFQGSLGSSRGIAETLVAATPLLTAGLAVALSFQGGLFNIGVEGQLVVGGLVAGAIGAKIALPAGIHVIVAILAAALGGAVWALIPALLKAYRGVHEVITTIMMNYVAFSLSTYLVSPGGPLVSATQPSATDKIRSTARLARIWEPTRLHAGVLVAAGLCVACWWLLYRTTAGYRIRVVGANPGAARFNGIGTRRVIVSTMCLSGALAGCAGAIEVLGLHGRYFDSFSPGYGYDSIAVALLGLMNPFGVAAAALFFGILRAGSVLLQARAKVSKDMVTVISGLVVAFVAARVVVERRLQRRDRSDRQERRDA